jgi:hypothetical protein
MFLQFKYVFKVIYGILLPNKTYRTRGHEEKESVRKCGAFLSSTGLLDHRVIRSDFKIATATDRSVLLGQRLDPQVGGHVRTTFGGFVWILTQPINFAKNLSGRRDIGIFGSIFVRIVRSGRKWAYFGQLKLPRGFLYGQES